MFSSDIRIDGLESDSKYVFQYVKNVELRNAKITTKDAFWEVENVTIYDSELKRRISRLAFAQSPVGELPSRRRPRRFRTRCTDVSRHVWRSSWGGR